MTRFARAEREALCDTFLAVGPAAPTLCGSWTTADLAVHLVVRDGRPDLMIGPRLPIVGTVGLILIVLEGALDLEVSTDRARTIAKAGASAVIGVGAALASSLARRSAASTRLSSAASNAR